MIKEFTLQNKHFINLSLITKDSIKSIQGFYEKNWQGSNFTFYIKHKKDRREYITNNVIYNEFGIYNEFLVAKNNSYFIIKSKKNITDLFKDQEKEIKTFYDDNVPTDVPFIPFNFQEEYITEVWESITE
jgi:hypothetical protein